MMHSFVRAEGEIVPEGTKVHFSPVDEKQNCASFYVLLSACCGITCNR